MKRIFQKMKLFHKTFLMMLAAFSVVIIISDAVIVLFLPKLYLNRLQSDLHAHMERLTPLIEATDWQHCDELLESFAFRNNINIYAKHGEEEKTFRVTAFYVFTDIYEDMQVTMKDVENAVDKLTSMVNEILAASQIQGAAGQAERTLLLVQEEIGQLLADYEVLAKIRNLSISFEVEKELQLNMNPRYFRQVWSNLIDNAIRYTPTGGRIRITGNSNVLAIWNSCKPLSGVQLQKIFDPFYRGEDAKRAYSAGTGLGLYLVKEILNANQLPFSFVPYDGGMRFQIRLPRA